MRLEATEVVSPGMDASPIMNITIGLGLWYEIIRQKNLKLFMTILTQKEDVTAKELLEIFKPKSKPEKHDRWIREYDDYTLQVETTVEGIDTS